MLRGLLALNTPYTLKLWRHVATEVAKGVLVLLSGFCVAHSTHVYAGTFNYTDFSSTAGLSLNGSAMQVGNVLRLTPAINDQGGAIWFTTKQPVESSFETAFQFRINQDGADGIAFVIQNHSVTALGGFGGGQGYEFLPNSLAVEFDTWQNIPGDFASGLGDPNDNHISVQTRGELPNSPDPVHSLGSTTAIPFMSDGNPHTVKLLYTPGSLRIFMDDLDTPALVVAVDLGTTLDLDDGQAWVGLTAATGGAVEEHDILRWSFTSPTQVVSEPTTTALFMIGLAGVTVVARIRGKRGRVSSFSGYC